MYRRTSPPPFGDGSVAIAGSVGLICRVPTSGDTDVTTSKWRPVVLGVLDPLQPPSAARTATLEAIGAPRDKRRTLSQVVMLSPRSPFRHFRWNVCP